MFIIKTALTGKVKADQSNGNHIESFFIGLSENTVALKTTENRLDKENKNAYNITKHVYKKVKPPLLHYYNMVFLQSQGFCSEKFLQNRTKADQDNLQIWRLEAGVITKIEV